MNSRSIFVRYLAFAGALLALAGCANQMEPAQQAIAGIEAAVAAAGADAARYVPDQVAAVTEQITALRTSFDAKDYKGVLAAAPALLAQAQGLAGAAATARQTAMDALNSEWGGLAANLPAAVSAIQSRVDILSQAKKLPAGMDADMLASVQSGLAEVNGLWTQATSAQAAGDLEQAVSLATQVKEKADGLISTLGLSTG